MRRVFDLILTLAVVVLLGAGFILVRSQRWWPEVTAFVMGRKDPTPAKAVKTAASSKEESKHHRGSSGADSAGSDPLSAKATPAPMPVTRVVVMGPARFPTDREIRAGETKAALVTAYGTPDVTTTLADYGELHERYVYFDKDTHRKTFVALVDGKVASAETLSQ